MLHPKQFKPNDAWIFFRLNEAPIHAGRNGEFNLFALMDAASCFILGTELIPAVAPQLTRSEFNRLLADARRHTEKLPETLFISESQGATLVTRAATSRGVNVVRIAESELFVFIGEAREGFAEYLKEQGGA